METDVCLWQYIVGFFLEWVMLQTTVVDRIKTHILFSMFLPPPPQKTSCKSWDNVEKYGRASLTTDDNIVRHMHFSFRITKAPTEYVDCVWNVMAHGDAREGKWRGNWRMEWVASTLHTTSERGISSITADSHTSAASSRLNWRPPADLNGLVRFAERRNLVSVRVPSHFNWPLKLTAFPRLQW